MINKSNVYLRSFSQLYLVLTPFICSCFVVGLHSYNISTNNVSSTSLVEGFLSHGAFTAAVPTFFMISGYLFFKSVNTIKDVIDKIRRRFFSLFVPFVAWSFFYYFFYLVIGNLFDISTPIKFSVADAIKSILLYKYVFPMWYMLDLCIFIVLSPIIFFVKKSPNWVRYILLFSLFICGLLGLCITIRIDDIERSFLRTNYFFYFIVGCFISRNNLEYIFKLINRIPIYISFAIYVIFSLLSSLVYDEIIPIFNHRILIPIVVFTFQLLIFQSLQFFVNHHKTLSIIKQIPTLIIYGIHPFIGICLNRIIPKSLPLIFSYFGVFLLNFLISSMVGFLIKKIKPLNIVFNGNR